MPNHQPRFLRILLAGSVAGLLFIPSCFPEVTGETASSSTPSLSFSAEIAQSTVDAMRSLASNLGVPTPMPTASDYPKSSDWFDVNIYFTVLKHISMKPGYTLDYVYSTEYLGAKPYLYARKTSSPPFKTMTELMSSFSDQSVDHTYDYLGYINCDGSGESFFELTLLRIVGGQFYLWWHANYDDTTVVCTKAGFDKLASSFYYSSTLPPDISRAASTLDFTPIIKSNTEPATVRIVVFTKWGGFSEQIYSISQDAIPTVSLVKSTTLVPYEIGFVF